MPFALILAALLIAVLIIRHVLHRGGCGEGHRLSDYFCRVWKWVF
jgi:hypothetical protein